MITIDTQDSLTQQDISNFGSQLKDNDIITISYNSTDIISGIKSELIYKLFNDEKLNNVDNSDILRIYTNDIELIFNGYNYLWWKKTNLRRQKFENSFMSITVEKTTRKKKEILLDDSKIYSVGVATVIDNELTNIHHFSGSKNDCIQFINDDMFKRYVDVGFNSKIVVNLAFDENEFKEAFENDNVEAKHVYKHNLELWYTLEELEDIGAITLK